MHLIRTKSRIIEIHYILVLFYL